MTTIPAEKFEEWIIGENCIAHDSCGLCLLNGICGEELVKIARRLSIKSKEYMEETNDSSTTY